MDGITVKIPAIEKLLDYTASGVGAIAGPMLAPWAASREAKARLGSARIDAETRRIEAESEAETSAIIAKARADAREYLVTSDSEIHGTAEITREDIIQRIEFQERKRISNVKSVVDDAADELGDKEVDDHEPDPDWTARFFDCVQDVSSEDMQKLWAKILAGEVESQGRTSLRTLETLRNMTKHDAEVFHEVCEFVIAQHFVFYDDSVKDLAALSHVNLLHLEECGLVQIGHHLINLLPWSENWEIVLPYQDGGIIITSNSEPTEMLGVPVVGLTSAGCELSPLAQCTVNMEYLQAFSRFLKSKDCRLDYMEGVQELPSGGLSYARRILIEPEPDQREEATL
jgi:hypothetical protein